MVLVLIGCMHDLIPWIDSIDSVRAYHIYTVASMDRWLVIVIVIVCVLRAYGVSELTSKSIDPSITSYHRIHVYARLEQPIASLTVSLFVYAESTKRSAGHSFHFILHARHFAYTNPN